jgi:hypothetical protein
MKLNPKFTHEEHLDFAKRVLATHTELNNLYSEVVNRYGKSSRTSKTLSRVIKIYSYSVRSELDLEYHKVTSEKQFLDKGHVYYNPRS